VFEESGVAIGAGDAGGVEWLFGGFDCGKRRKMGEMGEGRDGMKAGMSGEQNMSQEQVHFDSEPFLQQFLLKGIPQPTFPLRSSRKPKFLLLSSKYTNGPHFYPNVRTLAAKRDAQWDVRLVVLLTVPSRLSRSDDSPKCSCLLYISKMLKGIVLGSQTWIPIGFHGFEAQIGDPDAQNGDK
jgi:hypothetical protein